MLTDSLSKFTNGGSLFDACTSLLADLHIQFDRQTEEPINIGTFYDGDMPKYLSDALNFVDRTYFIGVVNDLSLKGKAEEKQLSEHIANAEEQQDKYSGMFLFAIDANVSHKLTRSELTALTRAFNRISVANPVTLFIREGNNLSISSCERMNYNQTWRKGEKLGKVSILGRIDCESPHRGHLDILAELDAKKLRSFDKLYAQWLKVFNTSILTSKFYDELFKWYEWAAADDSGITFDTGVPDKWKEDRGLKIIRLITRLMFVWFIKQKGLVPERIFDAKYLGTILKDFDPQSESQGNYYWAILQNLFFATLNHPIIEDGEKRGFTSKKGQDVKNIYRYEEEFSISKDEVVELFSKVPFLNCGLFECQDKSKTIDGKENYYNDGFTRNNLKDKDGHYKHRAFIPNKFFFDKEHGIISIFDRYVFTIEENTPQDVQVALDPELLGKVFENLLGAYNPETQKTARKESGSFYSPREIVQNMVDESLVAYLKRVVGPELETQYRQLLDYTTEQVELTEEQKHAIMQALIVCKILDPACGSGAFPMGMLQQMVHILQQVDPDNNGWRNVLINLATEDSRRAFNIANEEERENKLKEIVDTFNNSMQWPDYTRKLYLIESCIYGVDIQPIAMLITRLRFFITLVCEQKKIRWDDPEHNYGIQTLPNLESKFVAADSLIDADIHKYNNDWTNNEALNLLKNELIAIRKEHFYTRKYSQKTKLLKEDEKKRKQIKALITKLVGEPNKDKIASLEKQIAEDKREQKQYEGENWVETNVQTELFAAAKAIRYDKNKSMRDKLNQDIKNCQHEIDREIKKTTPQGFEKAVLQVTEWNPYDQTTVSPFLDIEWMFGITDGFDIIIGNPPYIQLQDNKGKLSKKYEPCHYQTFDSTGDIYCLFYECGNNLLRKGGILCYITSNKWMRAGYGENLRSYLTSQTKPLLLIDFGETHVFESATVMTNILLFEKESNEAHKVSVNATQIGEDFTNPSELRSYIVSHSMQCTYSDAEQWVIMPDGQRAIKKKVEEQGYPLKNWNIKINYGIKTGYNPAFFVTEEERQAILDSCISDNERKRTDGIIRPMLRGKDITAYGNRWKSTKLYLIGTFPALKLDIDKYPSIKKHLLSFHKERLEQTGLTYNVNGGKIKARKKTHGKWFETQDNIAYYKEFDKPKIVYPNMTKYMPFYYDVKKFLQNDKSFFITGHHIAYLTAFLNSSLFKYCFRDNFAVLFGGSREVRKVFMIEIPVKDVEDSTDKEFESLVTDIQNEYTVEKAKAIDEKIFDIYGLTPEERKAVGFIDFHNKTEEDTDNDD